MESNKTCFGFVRWAWWRFYYLFVSADKTLAQLLKKTERCWWPWFEFKPCVWHNDAGKQWEVSLEDERSYSGGRETISIEFEYAMSDNRITGFTIFDETLETRAKERVLGMVARSQSLRWAKPE